MVNMELKQDTIVLVQNRTQLNHHLSLEITTIVNQAIPGQLIPHGIMTFYLVKIHFGTGSSAKDSVAVMENLLHGLLCSFLSQQVIPLKYASVFLSAQ